MLNPRQRRDLLGLSLLALGLFVGLSLVPAGPPVGAAWAEGGNLMGVLGAAVAHFGGALLGPGVWLLPAMAVLGGVACFGWLEEEAALRLAAFGTGLLAWLPAAVGVATAGPGVGGARPVAGAAAGWLGRTLSLPLVALLGTVGACLALVFGLLALVVAVFGRGPLLAAAAAVRAVWARLVVRRASPEAEPGEADAAPGAETAGEPDPLPLPWEEPSPEELAWTAELPDLVPAPAAAEPEEPESGPEEAKPRRAQPNRAAVREPMPFLEDTGDLTATDLPTAGILSQIPARDASLGERELDRLGQVLIDTLKTFKVEGQIVGRTTGPQVTQFEVVPAPGIKVNKIASLDADLALALKAASVRIVAPIPGKGAVGVEVPNPEPDAVYLREILEASAFSRSRGVLPLALGKDLTGKPYVADLARMPHLLIAGATGSGKSVCINTLITSLIYKHPPGELRLLMVDPKMVELSMYGDLPHLRHPVVTDPKDAATVLKWAVLEMERRYALLSENGVRSIVEFNKRVEEGAPLRRAEPKGDETDPDQWIYTDGPLPYLVVIVDELADLMMAVQSEVERPLVQLAQKARAIGIHLIVATQRPSVNVITGLLKANFPCRIAFRVSSKVDSRTILDQNGADALLGNGDMLFLPPGRSDPERIQGAFVSTEDTERLMAWYRDLGLPRPEAEDDILDVVRSREAEESGEELSDDMAEERDALFRQAAEVCVQFQQGSTSLLQRRLRIGYGRAARIIDQLHHAGILGPPDGSKPREVLVGADALDFFEP